MGLKDFRTQNGDDYGYPIQQYKRKLKDGNVFLIANLNEVSTFKHTTVGFLNLRKL